MLTAMSDEQPHRVCLEIFEGGDIESVVVGFRQAGELHELTEASPPVRVILEHPAVWMKDECDLDS